MMSDEKNPIVENPIEEEVTGDGAAPAEAVAEVPADATAEAADAPAEPTVGDDAAAEATVAAIADEAPATEAVVASAPEPVAPSAPTGALPEEVAVGPREYAPAYESGGRSRRTSIDVRLEEVNYKNVPLLSRFIDPRGRILSRRKTRVSAKVQRRVVNSIKLARHLALLPYTADQTRVVRKRR